MKHLFILITLCTMCISSFAQGFVCNDSKVKKFMKVADKYIEDFHYDSVTKVYPVYDVFRKEIHKDTKFNKIPTFTELEPYLDFKHLVLDYVFAQTSDNNVWVLIGKFKGYEGFSYTKSMEKDINFFKFLEEMTPDKIYSLFGQGYLVFEKDGERYIYNRNREKGELLDFYQHTENPVEHFNVYDFPRSQKTSLMIGYGK